MIFTELTSASGILASTCFILLIIQLGYAFVESITNYTATSRNKKKKSNQMTSLLCQSLLSPKTPVKL